MSAFLFFSIRMFCVHLVYCCRFLLLLCAQWRFHFYGFVASQSKLPFICFALFLYTFQFSAAYSENKYDFSCFFSLFIRIRQKRCIHLWLFIWFRLYISFMMFPCIEHEFTSRFHFNSPALNIPIFCLINSWMCWHFL